MDQLVLNNVDYQSRALHLHHQAKQTEPALLMDRKGPTFFQLALTGQVKDWLSLRKEIPELDVLCSRFNTNLVGGADFDVELHKKTDRDSLALTIDAANTDMEITASADPLFAAPRDLNKNLKLKLIHDRQQKRIMCPQAELRMQDLYLSTSAVFPQNLFDLQSWKDTQQILALLPAVETKTIFRVEKLENLADVFPALKSITAEWQGPLKFQTSLQQKNQNSLFSANVEIPASTCLTIGEWFDKSADEKLTSQWSMQIPHEDNTRSAHVGLDVNYGSAHLQLEHQQSQLSYHCALTDNETNSTTNRSQGSINDTTKNTTTSPPTIDAHCTLPITIHSVEKLASLSPKLNTWINHHDLPQTRGDTQIIVGSSFSSQPYDWIWNNEFTLAADELAIDWDKRLQKPKGDPLQLTAAYQVHALLLAEPYRSFQK